MKQSNPIALLPIWVFLCLYLGLGITFEYILKIPMGFYNIPVVFAYLVAIFVACLQNRAVSFDKKLGIMAQGMADKNIITMLLIFLVAGSFVGVVGRGSAESVAYFMLSLVPAEYSASILFVVSCFVSMTMGTSVGTITLITPIAVAVSTASGFDAALCVGSVMGGAMFGDNLSLISDTTIAACNGQGCPMQDKFRANFKIALPAAIAALVLIQFLSMHGGVHGRVEHDYDLLLIIPYVIVLVCGIMGMNVFIVLLLGIISGAGILLCTAQTTPVNLIGSIGTGAAGMFETCMVAILVSVLGALIRDYGGFATLLSNIQKWFKGTRGGRLGIGVLVSVMDIATANNTVAIVMANPIAKEMSECYGISSKQSASLLDTFSCIMQGLLPYGAQMLVALSAAHSLGVKLSAFDIIPCMFYPFFLLVSSLVWICVGKDKA